MTSQGQAYTHAAFPRIHDLGRAAVALAVLWTALKVLSAILLPQGDAPNQLLVVLYAMVTLLGGVVLLVNYVVVCRLLQTARRTVTALDPGGHARSGVWVWLGWWVPVVAWWFPYQVVRDIREAARRALGLPPGSPDTLRGWWATWLLLTWTSQLATRLTLRGHTGTAVMLAEWAAALAALLGLVLWVRVIRELVALQDRLVARPAMPSAPGLPSPPGASP